MNSLEIDYEDLIIKLKYYNHAININNSMSLGRAIYKILGKEYCSCDISEIFLKVCDLDSELKEKARNNDIGCFNDQDPDIEIYKYINYIKMMVSLKAELVSLKTEHSKLITK